MSGTRLVLVEGMIGSGKSTTAAWIETWLSRRGEDVRAFLEFDEDHPIRTKAVDRLRAASAQDSGSRGSAGNALADDPGVYAAGQWRRLAERCAGGQRTAILDGTFLQNSVMPPFIDGASANEVTEVFTEILRQAAPAEPLLVYLRPTDLAAAVARVHRSRGQSAMARNIGFVENSPWARRRNLRGPGAVVELYRAWEAFVDVLYDQYPFPKLMVTDPQDDWPAARARIGAALRP